MSRATPSCASLSAEAFSNTDTKENTHLTVVERFLKLVSYPTTSDEASETCPSTARQLALAQELVRQMQDMGIADARVDKDGYVYGTVPANCEKDIPVYGLIAHMDTSPDAPGENIRARITEPYDGGDIVLNEEKHIMLSPKEYPQLKNSVGKRLIVTDGTTLLGADDKAGVAEILSAAQLLLTSEKPHGTVKLAFTPDEEIGRGADRFDVAGFGADYAYTVDGFEAVDHFEDAGSVARAEVVDDAAGFCFQLFQCGDVP